MHLHRRGSSVLVAAVMCAALGGVDRAIAQSVDPEPVTQTAAVRPGSIDGTVIDDRGAPLAGVVVSALGSTVAFALTDPTGRFTLRRLPPGAYVVRAHLAGFAASRREIVNVSPSVRLKYSVRLHRLSATAGLEGTPAVMTAGVGGDTTQEAPDVETSPAARPHDHGETAWRLRHAKRSVLKDSTAHVAAIASSDPPSSIFGGGPVSFLGRAIDSSARFAASLFNDLPFSGQVNLLTISQFDRPQDLLAFDGLPRGMAYISIGAPAGATATWSVRGAMTDGDVSSWILAGAYTTRPSSVHALDLGMSYSTQRYEGGNPAALAAVTDGSRNVGTVQAFDRWAIAPRVEVLYGTRYAWHAYLPDPALFSPRLGVAVSPADRTHVRALVSQRMLAPGAEEFVPPSGASLWLPPARTFSPLESRPFQAERTRHVEVGLEHELSDSYVVAVRGFHQSIDDQLVTLFGVRSPGTPRSDLGHYHVANAGSLEARGWGVSFSRVLLERLWGTVDYTLTSAMWQDTPDVAKLRVSAPAAVRPASERFHDLTTSLHADIPETATRVLVLYKMNTAFTRAELDRDRTGLDGRFDIQIRQALPFLRLTSTDWEFLLAVRNVFHELEREGSVYDELLVVRPPKRLVGGFVVKF